MACQLKASEQKLWDEVADVKRISGGIKSAIKGDGPLIQALVERREIGAVGQEAAPLEVFNESHIWAGR